MDIGFDNIFNIHMWRMGGDQGWLYVGTQDQSTKWRELAGLGSRLAPRMGFDLFATDDGWYFTAISRNGLGDRFNNGVRNFASTPFGFFLGGANHYYGMEIFRARAGVVAESEVEQRPTRSRLRMLRDSVSGEPAVSPDPPRSNVLRAPPQRLEVEMGPRGAVLSWEGAPYATRFRVFRDSGSGDPIALRSTRTAVRPTATGAWYFVDTAVFGRDTYHYQVVGEDPHGNASGVSNMARFPSRAPRVTFALLDELVPDAPSSVKALLVSARAAAARGDLDLAATELQALRRLLAFPGVGLPAWRTEDIEMLIAKLQRRVSLAKVGAIRAEGLLE
jgi:hypothetical protein